jgi:hypothetical protein
MEKLKNTSKNHAIIVPKVHCGRMCVCVLDCELLKKHKKDKNLACCKFCVQIDQHTRTLEWRTIFHHVEGEPS